MGGFCSVMAGVNEVPYVRLKMPHMSRMTTGVTWGHFLYSLHSFLSFFSLLIRRDAGRDAGRDAWDARGVFHLSHTRTETPEVNPVMERGEEIGVSGSGSEPGLKQLARGIQSKHSIMISLIGWVGGGGGGWIGGYSITCFCSQADHIRCDRNGCDRLWDYLLRHPAVTVMQMRWLQASQVAIPTSGHFRLTSDSDGGWDPGCHLKTSSGSGRPEVDTTGSGHRKCQTSQTFWANSAKASRR